VKFEVDEFVRKVEQLEAFKSNLLNIGNNEARLKILQGVMSGSLENFLGANPNLINEINLYMRKNSSLISIEFFNEWNEHSFEALVEIVKNIASNTDIIRNMLKNNSLKISSLVNQSSDSLATKLIQEMSNQFSSFIPKFNDLTSFNLKFSDDFASIFNLFSSLQLENSHLISSISTNFDLLFKTLTTNKTDLFKHFSDSINFNLGKFLKIKSLYLKNLIPLSAITL
jgi:hypothetical protein